MELSPREESGCYMSPVQREVLVRLFALDFVSNLEGRAGSTGCAELLRGVSREDRVTSGGR